MSLPEPPVNQRRRFLRLLGIGAGAGAVGFVLGTRYAQAPPFGELVLTDDFITLKGLTADPALNDGRIWYRSDIDQVRVSRDGVGVVHMSHDAFVQADHDVLLNPHHPTLHEASHEFGGGDALDLGSIAGALIAAQHPSGLGANLHHTSFVQSDHDALANPHHAQLHALAHQALGGDALDLGSITGVLIAAQHPSGLGANLHHTSFVQADHDALANPHHAQDHKARHVSGGADAFTSTDLIEAIIKRIQESSGPTTLLMGAVADGEFLKRSGTSIIGGVGGGAPSDADYLVGTINAGLSNEIVVGTTPGGELGGTWLSPTVDSVHSGSAHHAELHALAHQSLGGDALALGSIAGALIAAQHPSGLGANLHHTSFVQADHDALLNPHHAQLHALAHQSLGGDALALGSIAGALIAAQHPSGLGANLHHTSFVQADHDALLNPHHAQLHLLATATALGPDHTISGAAAGEVLRALTGTTAAFDVLQHVDLGGVGTDQHHAQAHAIDGADHSLAGSAAGRFMRATSATAFAFEAISISRGGTLFKSDGIIAAVNIIVWRAPYACTVTNVRGYRVGGTGATINARLNGVSNHLASALSLTSADTWMDGGAVQNTAYAAGDKLEIMVVTVAGSPTQVAVQVDYTRP